jgi:hypothetical protein
MRYARIPFRAASPRIESLRRTHRVRQRCGNACDAQQARLARCLARRSGNRLGLVVSKVGQINLKSRPRSRLATRSASTPFVNAENVNRGRLSHVRSIACGVGRGRGSDGVRALGDLDGRGRAELARPWEAGGGQAARTEDHDLAGDHVCDRTAAAGRSRRLPGGDQRALFERRHAGQ